MYFTLVKTSLSLLILREVIVCFADPEVNKLYVRKAAAARDGRTPNNCGCLLKAQACKVLSALNLPLTSLNSPEVLATLQDWPLGS